MRILSRDKFVDVLNEFKTSTLKKVFTACY